MASDIRAASPQDGEAVWRVRSASWEQAYSGFLPPSLWSEETMNGFLQRWPDWLVRSTFFDVAVVEGIIQGYVATKFDPEDTTEPSPWMVQALYVHPEAQGIGLGRRLMAHATQRLIEIGAATIGIAAFKQNPKAGQIYRHWGGICTGEGTFDVLGVPYPDERFRYNDLPLLLRRLKSPSGL